MDHQKKAAVIAFLAIGCMLTSAVASFAEPTGNNEEPVITITNNTIDAESGPTRPGTVVAQGKDQDATLLINLDGEVQQPEKVEPGFIDKVISATKGLVGRAVSWLGTRYVWGGTSRRGVDCSGLTQQLYAKEGIKLPHSAKLQYKKGKPVSKDALLPGDLVFFNTRGPITHVGLYIGEKKFLHAANPRRGVRIDSISAPYYNKRYAGDRRLKNFS